MKFSIRLAKLDEIEELIELQSLSISTLQSGKYSEQQIQAIVQHQKSVRYIHDEIIFVAESNDRTILGFASLLVKHPQIGGVFVHPQFICQGIGTELVKELEKVALHKKIRTGASQLCKSAISLHPTPM